ncbi:hypothetical protein B296_00055438 [Ensete ventricosum]|uniref:Uncharacterized protein n=1 Tax=Ensete ventricosum TaxID=4639 RepID=A0A426X6U3_ENSVE|nr:hypothetical protein B296_00055438 [Ensete ventricosum]
MASSSGLGSRTKHSRPRMDEEGVVPRDERWSGLHASPLRDVRQGYSTVDVLMTLVLLLTPKKLYNFMSWLRCQHDSVLTEYVDGLQGSANPFMWLEEPEKPATPLIPDFRRKRFYRTKPILETGIAEMYRTLLPERMVVVDLGCS